MWQFLGDDVRAIYWDDGGTDKQVKVGSSVSRPARFPKMQSVGLRKFAFEKKQNPSMDEHQIRRISAQAEKVVEEIRHQKFQKFSKMQFSERNKNR